MRTLAAVLLFAVPGCDSQDAGEEGRAIHAQALPSCGDAVSGGWEEGFGAPLEDTDPLITDVAATADGVIAVGWIDQFGTGPLVARFDGQWRDVPTDPENENLRRVVVLADGSIVLGGTRITRSDGTSSTTIADQGLSTGGALPLLADADGALYFVAPEPGQGEVMRWREGTVDSFGVVDFDVSTLAIVDGELVAAGTELHDSSATSRIAVLRAGAWESLDMVPGFGIDDLLVAPSLGVVMRNDERLRVAGSLDGPWTDLGTEEMFSTAACDGGLFGVWRASSGYDPIRYQLGFFDGSWQPLGEDRPGYVARIASSADGVYLAAGEDDGVLFWRYP
ncbi:MAG TPA: hypothetical protein VKB80_13985 [Kofleriaceae bacterium]|nr:hypothetical protein [Kofleriaceae bacterium]